MYGGIGLPNTCTSTIHALNLLKLKEKGQRPERTTQQDCFRILKDRLKTVLGHETENHWGLGPNKIRGDRSCQV